MRTHNKIQLVTSLTLILTIVTGTQAWMRSNPPNILTEVLADNPDKFARFTDDPARYRLQVLLSVVHNTDNDKQTVVRYYYRHHADYFYPASSIKTFAAAAALIKLQELREETGLPIDHKSPLVIHPLFDDEKLQDADPTNVATGKMTIEQEIRKTLLVSSNDAYNHLFEFVGHQQLHDILANAGLPNVRLNHRLSEYRSREDNRRSPRIDLLLGDGQTLTLPERTSTLVTDNAGLRGLEIGKAYISGDKRVDEPLNFLNKNHASLEDLQNFLIMIVRPDIDLGAPALPLSDADRAILLTALSQHPYESKNPVYTPNDISEPDGYPLFQPGLERVAPREDLLLYAKGGTAYGFKIANAAITHKPTGKTFFLAATLYTNSDAVLNDDHYDYDLADEFLTDLAEAVARELWAD
jgi:Beta-lactamase enzyme family